MLCLSKFVVRVPTIKVGLLSFVYFYKKYVHSYAIKTCIDSGQLLQNVFEFIDSKNCISVTISKIKVAVMPLFKEIKKCLLEQSNIFFGFS